MDIVQEIQLLEERQRKREHKHHHNTPHTMEMAVNTYHVDENNPDPHPRRTSSDGNKEER